MRLSGPLLRVTFATIVRFMTDRYLLHEQSVKILQYKCSVIL